MIFEVDLRVQRIRTRYLRLEVRVGCLLHDAIQFIDNVGGSSSKELPPKEVALLSRGEWRSGSAPASHAEVVPAGGLGFESPFVHDNTIVLVCPSGVRSGFC
jgi:hypothetical protein